PLRVGSRVCTHTHPSSSSSIPAPSPVSRTATQLRMSVQTRMVVVVAVLMVVLAVLSHPVSAGYRKPPFNGSIFGKRSGDVVYEPGKALASACQVAVEACAAWFPQTEKK
ncbi:hypothetical protein OTU49_001147, partial [Cherax quadricarinatus]